MFTQSDLLYLKEKALRYRSKSSSTRWDESSSKFKFTSRQWISRWWICKVWDKYSNHKGQTSWS